MRIGQRPTSNQAANNYSAYCLLVNWRYQIANCSIVFQKKTSYTTSDSHPQQFSKIVINFFADNIFLTISWWITKNSVRGCGLFYVFWQNLDVVRTVRCSVHQIRRFPKKCEKLSGSDQVVFFEEPGMPSCFRCLLPPQSWGRCTMARLPFLNNSVCFSHRNKCNHLNLFNCVGIRDFQIASAFVHFNGWDFRMQLETWITLIAKSRQKNSLQSTQ